MSELFFVIKMSVITFVVVILMQIQVGGDSVENQMHAWMQTSTPSLFLREIAEGGLKATHEMWVGLTSGIKSKYWEKFHPEKLPGKRQLKLQIERSEVFIEEQKSKAEKLIHETSAEAEREGYLPKSIPKGVDED